MPPVPPALPDLLCPLCLPRCLTLYSRAETAAVLWHACSLACLSGGPQAHTPAPSHPLPLTHPGVQAPLPLHPPPHAPPPHPPWYPGTASCGCCTWICSTPSRLLLHPRHHHSSSRGVAAAARGGVGCGRHRLAVAISPRHSHFSAASKKRHTCVAYRNY